MKFNNVTCINMNSNVPCINMNSNATCINITCMEVTNINLNIEDTKLLIFIMSCMNHAVSVDIMYTNHMAIANIKNHVAVATCLMT